MVSKITVGTTWNSGFIKKISRLNRDIGEGNNLVVGEVYGSIPGDRMGTARALDRLHGCNYDVLRDHTSECHNNGIKVNYANNSLCFGSHNELDETFKYFLEHIDRLSASGIDSITLAIPFFIEQAKKNFPDLKVKASTITHITNAKMVQNYVQLGADAIVLPVDSNRNFGFLEILSSAYSNVEFELLMTDACVFECPYRQNHFAMQSHDSLVNLNDFGDERVLNYPFDRCWSDLISNWPNEFLKSRWIRPEDISLYESLGFDNFKISGRTMPEEKILYMVENYLQRKYEGNFLNILPIIPGDSDEEGNSPLFIDNRSLDGFLDKFRLLGDSCNLNCGITCNFCDDFARDLKNE